MTADSENRRCIELIAAAALDRAQWPSALASIANRLRSDHALIFSNKSMAARWPFVATTGLADDHRARFFAPHTMRLWEPWHRAMTPGRVVRHQEVVGDRDFERTEIYNDVIRPTGAFHGTCFQHDGTDLSFHLNVCRRRQTGAFLDRETQALQALASHVTLALQFQCRLSVLEERVSLLSSTLDRISEGVIVVDVKGRPLVANLAAERLLEEADGLALTPSGLGGLTRGATDKFRAALVKAASPPVPHATRIHLPRRSPRPPLLLEILPAGQFDLSVAGSSRPFAVVLLREVDRPITINRSALMDFYRLTPREAGIALLLADGLTVEAIGAKLKLARGTIRNNLKRIFEKTDSHSQVALLALLRGFGS
ncbi:helix-turn-helix transcriptional regulator [Terrarubrum flagellatum]|uniref:helix-turn-helix transcriptional regulator n=1 Tax=Terrirubrum flagellatum TaxID=2895980 RepID=UPI0031454A3C